MNKDYKRKHMTAPFELLHIDIPFKDVFCTLFKTSFASLIIGGFWFLIVTIVMAWWNN